MAFLHVFFQKSDEGYNTYNEQGFPDTLGEVRPFFNNDCFCNFIDLTTGQ